MNRNFWKHSKYAVFNQTSDQIINDPPPTLSSHGFLFLSASSNPGTSSSHPAPSSQRPLSPTAHPALSVTPQCVTPLNPPAPTSLNSFSAPVASLLCLLPLLPHTHMNTAEFTSDSTAHPAPVSLIGHTVACCSQQRLIKVSSQLSD